MSTTQHTKSKPSRLTQTLSPSLLIALLWITMLAPAQAAFLNDEGVYRYKDTVDFDSWGGIEVQDGGQVPISDGYVGSRILVARPYQNGDTITWTWIDPTGGVHNPMHRFRTMMMPK